MYEVEFVWNYPNQHVFWYLKNNRDVPHVVSEWFENNNIDMCYCYLFKYSEYSLGDYMYESIPFVHGIMFVFENKNDALLFKTRWTMADE